MSTDWNIRCVDCNHVLHFSDANHEEEMMVRLIAHRDAIAALAPLLSEQRGAGRTHIEFRTYYGEIAAWWFAQHAGHALVPHNEYGEDLDQCTTRFPCIDCGAPRLCSMAINHDGAHAHRLEDRRAR